MLADLAGGIASSSVDAGKTSLDSSWGAFELPVRPFAACDKLANRFLDFCCFSFVASEAAKIKFFDRQLDPWMPGG